MMKDWREVRVSAVDHCLDGQDETEVPGWPEGKIQAHRLAEVRKGQRLTQVEIAERLGVGQPRISQIERSDLNRAELATLRAYIEALGGRLEISATLGGQRIRLV